MKHRIHSLLVGAMGLASAAFFALSGTSCSQPTIQCVVGHGAFFAKYTPVPGTDTSCYGLDGEDIGLSTYLAPNEDKTLANYDDRSIAIQSTTLGLLARQREGTGFDLGTDKPYAFGKLTTAPDANNLCYTGGAEGTAALVQADMNIEEFTDADGNVEPAAHYRQQWSNVKMFVTAGAPGTQAVGRMRFEDVLAGCSAEYTFVALFPSVYCGKAVDDDNNPDTDAADDDADTMNPDPDVPEPLFCSPTADPARGIEVGSGINPDFQTMCDPVTLHCILSGTPLTGDPE